MVIKTRDYPRMALGRNWAAMPSTRWLEWLICLKPNMPLNFGASSSLASHPPLMWAQSVGGLKRNIVPDSLRNSVDRRTLPGETELESNERFIPSFANTVWR